MMSDNPLLSVQGLTVSYGDFTALRDISFELMPGTSLAVLGVNGAGKTSLARAVSGLVRARSGTVTFANTDVSRMYAHDIRRLGLAHVPEGRGIFPTLSVQENLRMSVRRIASPSERREAIQRGYELFPVLKDRRRQAAGTLSGGEQQMLSLAGALASNPSLLIADELSLGLAPKMLQAVLDTLREAQRLGITMILIEQFVQRAIEFADHVLILRNGTASWFGESSQAGENVLAAYLGA